MLSKKSTSLINLIKEVLFILISKTAWLCLIADMKVRGNVVESQSDLLDSINKVVKNLGLVGGRECLRHCTPYLHSIGIPINQWYNV